MSFNPARDGASYALSELEIKGNPDLPVTDSSRIRGGGFAVDTLETRNAIPLALRKANLTTCYVQADNTTYILRGGTDNSNWIVFGFGQSQSGLRIGGTVSLLVADVGQPYSNTPAGLFVAPNGINAAVTAIGLPAGLSWSNGRISGTPVETGRLTVLLYISNGDNEIIQHTMLIVVRNTLTITGATYNEISKELTANISGGDGTVIEYRIIESSPSWQFNGFFTGVLPGQTLTIQARQSGYLTRLVYTTSAGSANQAPYVANPMPDMGATVGVPFSYTVPANTFADADGYIAGLAIPAAYPLPSWLSFNAATRTFTGTPLVSAGTAFITVEATDNRGAKVTDTFNLSVLNALPRAPTVANPVPDQSAVVGTPFSYVIPANTFFDIDGQITGVAVSALPAWLSYNATTRTLSGTPVAAGTVTITATATDNAGLTVPDTFIITVTGSAPVGNVRPVVSNPIGNKTAVSGSPYTLALPGNTFSDPDGSIASVAVSGLPAGLSYSAVTLTISGTPTVTGTFTITVTATDNGGLTATDTFLLVISAPANKPPVVSNPQSNKQGQVGQAFGYTIPGTTFSDPDGSIASVAVSGLPAGLSYSAVTLTISGTPTTAGSYTIVVTATDNAGAAITDTFTLTILGSELTVSEEQIIFTFQY